MLMYAYFARGQAHAGPCLVGGILAHLGRHVTVDRAVACNCLHGTFVPRLVIFPPGLCRIGVGAVQRWGARQWAWYQASVLERNQLVTLQLCEDQSQSLRAAKSRALAC